MFRVAAEYGATAFVIVQAADVLQEALRLPEAFLTGVAVLALLGFPLAALAGAALLATSAWWVLKPGSTDGRSYESIGPGA